LALRDRRKTRRWIAMALALAWIFRGRPSPLLCDWWSVPSGDGYPVVSKIETHLSQLFSASAFEIMFGQQMFNSHALSAETN